MICSRKKINVINRTLKKGIVIVLLLTAIPAYKFDTAFDYFACFFLDKCTEQQEES